jgi:hypothetical protein
MECRILTANEVAEVLRTTPGNLANMSVRGEGPSFLYNTKHVKVDFVPSEVLPIAKYMLLLP